MGLFSSKSFDSFEDMFLDQVKDLYDAEQRLIEALPKMADAAGDAALKRAFRAHLQETEQQAGRLEQIFRLLNVSPEAETCAAMKGLISEGSQIINANADADIKDAALIAAAQRVEHYEIAAYGSARTFAQRLGRDGVARLLQQTLDEEKAADRKLSQLAEAGINQDAVATGA